MKPRRLLDPVLWPVDVHRLHPRVPSADPHPIVVEAGRSRRRGSRAFALILAVLFLAAGVAGLFLAPAPWSFALAGLSAVLAGISTWQAARGPVVYAWVFAADGVGYRRRDGMVAWAPSDRVGWVESTTVRSRGRAVPVVRVCDPKRRVAVSAKPLGFDDAELLRAAEAKGHVVNGHPVNHHPVEDRPVNGASA